MSAPVQKTPWIWIPQHLAEGPSEVRAADNSLVCTVSSDEEAQFIAEAGKVFHETLMTPRQLASKVAAHQAELEALRERAAKVARDESRLEAVSATSHREAWSYILAVRADSRGATAAHIVAAIRALPLTEKEEG